MKKISCAMMATAFFLVWIFAGESLAVIPPSVEARKQAEKERIRDIKEKAKEQHESGCEYGRDKATGKCYEPREGQFYRDPKTGEIKVKGIKKINTPW